MAESNAASGAIAMVRRQMRGLAGVWVRGAGNALGSGIHRSRRLCPHTVTVCIYRCRNEATVLAPVAGLGLDAEIRLHCLDGGHPRRRWRH